MKTSHLLILGTFTLATIAVSSCAAKDDNSAAPAMPPESAAALPVPVSIAKAYNDQGIFADGATFSGGVDGDGFACSSNLLGTVQNWQSVPFQLGSGINGPNVVTGKGQTIALPSGNYSKLEMIAIAVNGAQSDQSFIVTYADGSTHAFSQSLSDWASPDSNSGESQAVSMDYRIESDGTKDENPYYLYGYSFGLNSTNAVQSLKLPDNDNVKVFAVTLVP